MGIPLSSSGKGKPTSWLVAASCAPVEIIRVASSDNETRNGRFRSFK